MKNKIEYIRAILLNVRDEAKEFTKSTLISSPVFATGVTTFDAESVEGFSAGDLVYFDDKTSASKFVNITSIDINNKKIVFTGDYHTVPSGTELVKTDALFYLDNAVMQFSQFRPLLMGVEQQGNGTGKYDLPEKWYNNFSVISLIEKPQGFIPPESYPEKLYKILTDADGKQYLQFAEEFESGDSFTIYFTTVHGWVLKEGETDLNPPKLTVTESDFYCVSDIASAYYLLGLASLYGQSVKGTISADSINYQTKTDVYRRLAKEYLGKAATWLGVSIDNLQFGITKKGAASSNQDASAAMQDRREFLKPMVIASINYGLYR